MYFMHAFFFDAFFDTLMHQKCRKHCKWQNYMRKTCFTRQEVTSTSVFFFVVFFLSYSYFKTGHKKICAVCTVPHISIENNGAHIKGIYVAYFSAEYAHITHQNMHYKRYVNIAFGLVHTCVGGYVTDFCQKDGKIMQYVKN